jgi:hypothetical protein
LTAVVGLHAFGSATTRAASKPEFGRDTEACGEVVESRARGQASYANWGKKPPGGGTLVAFCPRVRRCWSSPPGVWDFVVCRVNGLRAWQFPRPAANGAQSNGNRPTLSPLCPDWLRTSALITGLFEAPTQDK